jgi:hypothetical protein
MDVPLCGKLGANEHHLSTYARGPYPVTDIEIESVKFDDQEILEVWERITEEPRLYGVRAVRLPDDSWPWQIVVSVVERLADSSLEARLAEAIFQALEAHVDVECVEREERGLWVVAGLVSGRELVRIVAGVVDVYAPEARTS